MKTGPIRWICAICLKVARHSLTAYQYWSDRAHASKSYVRVYLPQCCGREMLLAGEAKRDIHGLREKGSMVDPVENLKVQA